MFVLNLTDLQVQSSQFGKRQSIEVKTCPIWLAVIGPPGGDAQKVITLAQIFLSHLVQGTMLA